MRRGRSGANTTEHGDLVDCMIAAVTRRHEATLLELQLGLRALPCALAPPSARHHSIHIRGNSGVLRP